jgi:hypothetical protein
MAREPARLTAMLGFHNERCELRGGAVDEDGPALKQIRREVAKPSSGSSGNPGYRACRRPTAARAKSSCNSVAASARERASPSAWRTPNSTERSARASRHGRGVRRCRDRRRWPERRRRTELERVRSSTRHRRRAMASMRMKLLLPHAESQLRANPIECKRSDRPWLAGQLERHVRQSVVIFLRASATPSGRTRERQR